MAPIQTAVNGRTRTGRFAKGNPGGPGRPRRPDLFTVVSERAASEGVDLEVELWQVCQCLIVQAKEGNVQAARLLFSHLCGDPVPQSQTSLPDATDEPLSDVEIARRIQGILSLAAARLQAQGRTKEAAEMCGVAQLGSILD